MLKLRKVEITGFKSFCERTVVTFSGTGTTCIVGPNGCGKSNVVDAISWVLGEQSHKSLRAGRMSDCIFNGTVKRPPMGLGPPLAGGVAGAGVFKPRLNLCCSSPSSLEASPGVRPCFALDLEVPSGPTGASADLSPGHCAGER